MKPDNSIFFTGFNGEKNKFTKKAAKIAQPSESDLAQGRARRKIEEINELKEIEREYGFDI